MPNPSLIGNLGQLARQSIDQFGLWEPSVRSLAQVFDTSLTHSPTTSLILSLTTHQYLTTSPSLYHNTPYSTTVYVSLLTSIFRAWAFISVLKMCIITIEEYGCGSNRIVRRQFCRDITSCLRRSSRRVPHWVRIRCQNVQRVRELFGNQQCHPNCPHALGQLYSGSHRYVHFTCQCLHAYSICWYIYRAGAV